MERDSQRPVSKRRLFLRRISVAALVAAASIALSGCDEEPQRGVRSLPSLPIEPPPPSQSRRVERIIEGNRAKNGVYEQAPPEPNIFEVIYRRIAGY